MSAHAVHRSMTNPASCLIALLGAVGGCVLNTEPLGPNSGPEGYLPKFTATAQLEASQVVEKGGNVGIGTADPQVKVDVHGVMFVTGTLGAYIHSTDPQRYIDPVHEADFATITSTTGIFSRSGEVPVDNTWAGYDFDGATSTSGFVGARIAAQWPKLGSNSIDTNLLFLTRSQDAFTEKMRIDAQGNVGIGTNAPASKLHVEGGNILVNRSASGADQGLLQLGGGVALPPCDKPHRGSIAYEDSGPDNGHFYGCKGDGMGGYFWYQLDTMTKR